MEINEYINDLQIEKIEPTDLIIINLSQCCSIEEAHEILKIFNNIFPSNKIIMTHPDLIQNVEVVRNEL